MISLVLSAGGLWAAWEIGAWKVLREHFTFDLIVGASAGAWNGWAIASGCSFEEIAELWRDPRLANVMTPGLHSTGLLRPEPMHEIARELFERFRPRTAYALTVVEIPSLRSRIVRGEEVRPEHLAAAASIPFGFPPVLIEGRRYVDGGFRAGLPLWAAEELGATRAIALNVLNTALFRVVRRAIWIKQPRGKMQVDCLEPSEPLGSLGDALRWNRNNIERWLALGERDANRWVSSVRI